MKIWRELRTWKLWRKQIAIIIFAQNPQDNRRMSGFIGPSWWLWSRREKPVSRTKIVPVKPYWNFTSDVIEFTRTFSAADEAKYSSSYYKFSTFYLCLLLLGPMLLYIGLILLYCIVVICIGTILIYSIMRIHICSKFLCSIVIIK